MKIAVNSSIYERTESGVPLYVKHLYRALMSIDKVNSYVFLQGQDTKTIGKTVSGYKIRGRIGLFLFNHFFVKKLLKRAGGANVFHGPAHTLPFFKIKNTYHVLTIHDLIFKKILKRSHFLFRTYHNYLLKRSIRQADHIIAVSQNTAKDIIDEYSVPKEKITVIYSGLHEHFVNQTPQNKIIPHKYLLSITTHPVRKNIFSVLSAIHRSQKLKEYTYVLAGNMSRKHTDKILQKSRELGIEKNILIKGYVSNEELFSLYQHAEFLIYPSFYEGFGFPVIEAFASKCPVITSNTSSMPELMPHKEWLVNPYDIAHITDAMEKMISLSKEERHILIEDNLEFSKKFTWQETARRTLEVFNKYNTKIHQLIK